MKKCGNILGADTSSFFIHNSSFIIKNKAPIYDRDFIYYQQFIQNLAAIPTTKSERNWVAADVLSGPNWRTSSS